MTHSVQSVAEFSDTFHFILLPLAQFPPVSKTSSNLFILVSAQLIISMPVCGAAMKWVQCQSTLHHIATISTSATILYMKKHRPALVRIPVLVELRCLHAGVIGLQTWTNIFKCILKVRF